MTSQYCGKKREQYDCLQEDRSEEFLSGSCTQRPPRPYVGQCTFWPVRDQGFFNDLGSFEGRD